MPDPSPVSVPILIGITGKRDLRGKEDAVRAALAACFELIDGHLPDSKKALLTGLASGADMVAAEEARKRHWSVFPTLPLPYDLYVEDFTEADDARRLQAFASDDTPALEPLIDPETGEPFPSAALHRVTDTPNEARTDHYEQAGIYIAERCALLIAVMPADEQAYLVGGTARIVDFRLRGDDETSRRIIEHSQVLRRRLDSPQTGPVWLIDLNTVDRTRSDPLRSVCLWEPLHHSPDVTHSGTRPRIRKVAEPSATALIEGAALAARTGGERGTLTA